MMEVEETDVGPLTKNSLSSSTSGAHNSDRYETKYLTDILFYNYKNTVMFDLMRAM